MIKNQQYIIDAFNLFYRWERTASTFRDTQDIGKTVKTSISKFSEFISSNKKHCTLIVDGGIKAGKSLQSGIKIEYSGGGRTADDVILEIVKKSTSPNRLTIVTTDHALGGNVKSLGAKVSSVEHFLTDVRAKNQNKKSDASEPLRKFIKPTEKEVEEWIELFGDCSDIIEEENI